MASNTQAINCKNEGDTLYREKKYQVAVMKYTQAINLLHPQGLTPTDESTFQTLYVSYSNRCACFLQVSRVEQALQDAKQCIKLKPDWPKGYIRLGSCYHRLGKFPDAIAAYEQVLAIDSTNEEAKQSLQRLRHQQNFSSSSSANYNGAHQNQPHQPNGPSFFQQLQAIDWQGYGRYIQLQLTRLYTRVLTFWMSLSPDTQKYIQIGGIVLFIYYFFIHRSISGAYYDQQMPPPHAAGGGGGGEPYGYRVDPSYRPRESYYDSSYHYGGNYSYGGGGGGMSWMTWGLIMFCAYQLPPMFPDQLGPQYARPFFGMNWTTFMWLLNMFSRNGGMNGFGGTFGGFGGRPMFGGRRRY